jgi:catechol 2,3-dioxygenase-like lactoylglutathione lyase family enzyme
MISNVSLVTLYCTDYDATKAFYIDVLGFAEGADVTMGDGFRWVTVFQPDHPELHITLMVPGPPLDDDMADAIRRSLAMGRMGGIGLSTDDCRKTVEALKAKGVAVVQEPADRPYGVEAVVRDNSGNWLVIVEQKLYSGGDFPHA